MNLLNNVKLTPLVFATTQTTTDLQGTAVVDMAGFDGVLLIGMHSTTLTAAGICRMWPMHSDSTSTTDMVSCTDADYIVGSTNTTTDMAYSTFVIDVVNPTKRYVSCYVDLGGQASEPRVLAIQYKNRNGAVEQSTGLYGVSDSVLVVAPTT